jgi:two-component system response regulator FixJ
MTAMTEANRIFLVDDDPSVRRALRRFLRSLGYSLQEFASGREFLEFISPDVKGCLILDVRMPEMDGLEVQRRLEAMGSPLKIIFITAYADQNVRERALQAGAAAFLEKPVSDGILQAMIQRALNESA